MTEFPRVRAQYTCVCCGGPKDRELILCWPCHHKEKRMNDGSYSAAVEQALRDFELVLSDKYADEEYGRAIANAYAASWRLLA